MNRPSRAQCFTGCGFILGLCGLAVLLSSLTKALDVLEDLKISIEIHQHALQGKPCFALSQANTSIATKADTRKAELQDKNCDIPSLHAQEAKGRFGAEFMGFHLTAGLGLYLWDFT